MDASQPWRKTLERINNEMNRRLGTIFWGCFIKQWEVPLDIKDHSTRWGPTVMCVYKYDGYILHGYIWWLYIYKKDDFLKNEYYGYIHIFSKKHPSIYIYISTVISSIKINKSSPSDLHHTSALNPANSRKPHRTTTSGCQNSGRNLGTSVPDKEHFQHT